jgi:membrane-associated phospholipid phosphatase
MERKIYDLWGATRVVPPLAWAILAFFLLVDVVWLTISPAVLAGETMPDFDQLALFVGVAYCVPQLVIWRVSGDNSHSADVVRAVAQPIVRFVAAALYTLLLGLAVCIFNVLTVRVGLPLQDARFAAIDVNLGFNWLRFLTLANANEALSQVLVDAYHSPDLQIVLLYLLLAATSRKQGIAEFLWLFASTLLVVVVIGALLPCVGAYTYYHPPRALFSHFSAEAGTWHVRLFEALRTQASPVFDLDEVRGLVQFPSFHTALAIITAYSIRSLPYAALPTALLNCIVIISTVPEGGHYLIDVIAGALVAVVAIIVLRARGEKALIHARTFVGSVAHR